MDSELLVTPDPIATHVEGCASARHGTLLLLVNSQFGANITFADIVFPEKLGDRYDLLQRKYPVPCG